MRKIFQLMVVLMFILVILGAVFAQAETKTYVVGTALIIHLLNGLILMVIMWD